MALDVVMVNYKTDKLADDFMASYEKHAWEGCTLTVVEVEREIDGDPLISNHWSRAERLLRFRDNVGYARACNAGAQHGRGDVILLANADTVLTEGLRECYDALVAHNDWGVLGPRQIDGRGAITAGGIYGTNQAPYQNAWAEFDTGQCSNVVDTVVSVSGSLYFIKRDVWHELTECPQYQEIVEPHTLGAFLPTQHYFEEMFCSVHARAHGYKCVFYGPVQMIHYWHQASPHGAWQDQEFTKSLALYRMACDHHGIPHE